MSEFTALIEIAKNASRDAYAPYSRFPVGAALRASDGTIYTGCNIENASYGMSMCAERVAMFKAVSSGARSFETLALFTPTDEPVSPCGACRQVLFEFASQLVIVSACNSPTVKQWRLDELFPDGFALS